MVSVGLGGGRPKRRHWPDLIDTHGCTASYLSTFGFVYADATGIACASHRPAWHFSALLVYAISKSNAVRGLFSL
ncbi:hypothetical protein L495_4883 [Bordetella bronchiseptica CARE970018BB]|nr:hypothetical protein L491_4922 [Bordetella bronchiseptica 3E44]KCV55138.1 hypothetical protein AZ14_4969 [Bordetella bronchiseptica 980]KDB68158.1 hypothetical protein AZ15_4972 [Bordetella bronchiseptica A1-7]KDB79015.1 hypothetical protein L495_4883 [Bordetella bronchiseptica CARE970018BB]KDC42742.1 hypothetical protein L508_4827 [Bordetella bronchiseptica M435/02/3]KDC61985.1 hypothetical protein L511_4804 [Bordetella bronchiseptica MBORD595]KDC64090.1 hypothetical protein L512_4902 [Bo